VWSIAVINRCVLALLSLVDKQRVGVVGKVSASDQLVLVIADCHCVVAVVVVVVFVVVASGHNTGVRSSYG
jgi:hypothetical protein